MFATDRVISYLGCGYPVGLNTQNARRVRNSRIINTTSTQNVNVVMSARVRGYALRGCRPYIMGRLL